MKTATAQNSAQSIELKVSLFLPGDNTNARLLAQLADEVKERSAGKLTLKLYLAEQLGRTTEQYDLVRNGGADIALVMHGTMPGRFPLTELATLPFVVPNARSGTVALLDALPDYLAHEHEGVHVLYLATNAPLAVHSQKALRSVEDFKNQRVRFPGSNAAATLAALGAVPVSVLPLDVRNALKDGTIDGAAMTYQGAGFSRLADCVKYSTDLYANTITFGLVMNPAAYKRLPDNLRMIVDEVLGASAGHRLAIALDRDAALGREYMRSGGVTLIEPDLQQREAFARAVQPVIAEQIDALAAKGLPAREVYDLLKASVARTVK